MPLRGKGHCQPIQSSSEQSLLFNDETLLHHSAPIYRALGVTEWFDESVNYVNHAMLHSHHMSTHLNTCGDFGPLCLTEHFNTIIKTQNKAILFERLFIPPLKFKRSDESMPRHNEVNGCEIVAIHSFWVFLCSTLIKYSKQKTNTFDVLTAHKQKKIP